MAATVSGVLRRFLPGFLRGQPRLSPAQRRAAWAIQHCRTAAMGGRLFACGPCGTRHCAHHSCNHKACPLCGRAATARWVERELGKLVGAPYFMVTFTLPAELRGLFLGPDAKAACDLFFAAAAGALAEKLARGRGLRAAVSGFTAVLHTWNQRLLFHPHTHCLVPGAGIRSDGQVAVVRNANFLLHAAPLRGAFRQHFRRLLAGQGREVDPAAWRKDWGVDVRPFGTGRQAVKYLAACVCRTAIADGRIAHCDGHSVTFRWKDRADGNRIRTETVTGEEFAARYLRHVLPRGLRSVRYYGFCHPAAVKNRERVRFHTGRPLFAAGTSRQPAAEGAAPWPCCPCCRRPMQWIGRIPPVRPSACRQGRPDRTRGTRTARAAPRSRMTQGPTQRRLPAPPLPARRLAPAERRAPVPPPQNRPTPAGNPRLRRSAPALPFRLPPPRRRPGSPSARARPSSGIPAQTQAP